MYLQMSYLSFDAEICDRAEFKTPLNVVFETRPFLLLLVLGYQAAGAQQLKGPCSLVSPRCTTKAQRSDGGWMGRDKESWRLRAGGAKLGASSLTNITIYNNYIVFSPFRTPQAYAWWSYSSPVKNRALVARFCAWCTPTPSPSATCKTCTHPTFLHHQKLDFIPIGPLPPSVYTHNTKLSPGGYINGGSSSSNYNYSQLHGSGSSSSSGNKAHTNRWVRRRSVFIAKVSPPPICFVSCPHPELPRELHGACQLTCATLSRG